MERYRTDIQGCQKTWNPRKTWNFEQKSLKKPVILNNFYILSSKISIQHKKYYINKKILSSSNFFLTHLK